ncbi:redoxin domain-containing protein [bacterium]|nr:redoxin domain-containing protein [bacterium]MBU1994258.1 redoxin domain-containing protein [bacterium]
MKEKIKHYIKEIILFFIFITVVANLISFYKSTDLNKVTLRPIHVTLVDKQKYILPHAKPVLIHFWATWCPTCKLEASNIQTISKHYEVLTIAVKSGTDDEIKKYLNASGYDFKVFNDSSGFLASEFKISAYPTTFIYDKDKKFTFAEVGYTSTLGLWLRMWWASF